MSASRPSASGSGAGAGRGVRTPEGRTLSHLEAGPADGLPVIYLHGIPSAAAE